MADWKFALGNLITRAATVGAASGGSAEDPLYPISQIGNGHPDDPSRFVWETDGIYTAAFDLNQLAWTSDRTDAPLGWRDLTLTLAGTPGLPTNPVEFGTFGTRANSFKFYGPVYQDIDVMPGEDLLLDAGLFLPAASTATGVRVVVINLTTGEQWDGADNEWNDEDDPLARTTTVDTWLDFAEPIVADALIGIRTTYRVILIPEAAAYDATTYAYCSAPTLSAAQDFVAFIGNNIPVGSTVTWSDGTATRTITPAFPSCYETGTSSSKAAWTLSITMPTNTKAWQPAPFIGELWAGRLLTLGDCPGFPFDVTEGDLGQIRLEGGLGRETVYTEADRLFNRAFKLSFKSKQDGYESMRDDFLRACRYGADPVLLAPISTLEGDTLFHGRVGPDATFSLVNRSRRQYTVNLRESPLPRFR